MSIPEFKTSFNTGSIMLKETADKKPYFKTANGLEGKVSGKVPAEIEVNGLANVQVSRIHNEPEVTGEVCPADSWLIHLRKSDETHAVIATL